MTKKLFKKLHKECMMQCQELIDKELGDLEAVLYVRQERENNKIKK